MKQKMIDTFFELLDKKLDLEVEVILVGASAGSLMGHIRPSVDIDFEIRLAREALRENKKKVAESILEIQRKVGVAVNYSENIRGWSRINYLEYRETALSYKKFGKLNVKLIAPEYWTIGKMARFYAFDIEDMIQIIQSKKIAPEKVVDLWARAVLESDLSLELGQFSKNVEVFLSKHGSAAWGQAFNSFKHLTSFQNQINI